MNNDSIIRECTQVYGQNSTHFGGSGAAAPLASVAYVGKTAALGPRLPRSSLAPAQLIRARTREEMQKLAADAWRQRGLALIDPLLISDDFARQALINEANRLYGRRAESRV